jgi:hypothetical protein
MVELLPISRAGGAAAQPATRCADLQRVAPALRSGFHPLRGRHSRPTKKLPNSQRILRLVTSDKTGICGMLRHCLIHPVAPLLSLLARLFRPFRSPVRGLRSAVTEPRNPLTFLVFCVDFARPAGPQKSFSPVIRAKTGEYPPERGRDRVRRVGVNARRGRSSQCRISFRGHLCVTIERYRARLKGPATSRPPVSLPFSWQGRILPCRRLLVAGPPGHQPSDRYGRIANEPGSARCLFANLPCGQGKLEKAARGPMSTWMRTEPCTRTRQKPIAQHRLQADLAPGFDEKPAAVVAAQDRERSGGRPQHRHAGKLLGGARQRAGGEVRGFGAAQRDQARSVPEPHRFIRLRNMVGCPKEMPLCPVESIDCSAPSE